MGSDGRVGLFVNRNASRYPEIINGRENGGWPDGLIVAYPRELKEFLPFSCYTKMQTQRVGSELSAIKLCCERPEEVSLCVASLDAAAEVACLEELHWLGIRIVRD